MWIQRMGFVGLVTIATVTDMKVHRAIALLKAVIGGTRREEEFVRQCLEIQGLL